MALAYGPNSPGTLVDDASIGTLPWGSPNNAAISDNSFASATEDAGSSADPIWDNAVRIVKGGSIGSTDKSTGVNWASSDPNSYIRYGGSSDLWGETWTVAQINASDFGIALSGHTNPEYQVTHYLKCTNFGFSIPSESIISGIAVEIERHYSLGGGRSKASVDHIRITVYIQGANSNLEPLKLGTMSLSQRTTSLTRVVETLPQYYRDSQVLKDIYKAILPEQDLIAHFLSTPDDSPKFPDADVAQEIADYLANNIGWGHERLVNQFFLKTVNKAFGTMREIYDVQSDLANHRDLRDRLIFVSRSDETVTRTDIANEVALVGVLHNITETFASYTVSISISPEKDEFREVVEERLNRILPAHLGITVVFAAMRLSDSPQGKLSDVPQNKLV